MKFVPNFSGKFQEEVWQLKSKINADPFEDLVLDIYRRFKEGISISTKTFLFKKFKNVFDGKEAIEWLQREEKMTYKEAKKIGNTFLKRKLIHHLSTSLIPFTEACFYRLGNESPKDTRFVQYM